MAGPAEGRTCAASRTSWNCLRLPAFSTILAHASWTTTVAVMRVILPVHPDRLLLHSAFSPLQAQTQAVVAQ